MKSNLNQILSANRQFLLKSYTAAVKLHNSSEENQKTKYAESQKLNKGEL